MTLGEELKVEWAGPMGGANRKDRPWCWDKDHLRSPASAKALGEAWQASHGATWARNATRGEVGALSFL